MDWTSFVKSELQKKNCLSDLKITFSGSDNSIGTPAVIKISIELLNLFLSSGEKHVVIVFPEIKQSSFFFTILKIINDISEGKVDKIYNPADFKKGQKLKCRNCVVEFERVEEKDGMTMLWVRDADCSVGVPIELAPFFQLTDTNRRLSKDQEFSKAKIEIKQEKEAMSACNQLTSMMIDYKTHFNNTVFIVSAVNKAKEMMSGIFINGVSIKDLLLTGQSDVEGNIDIINKGQLSGEPSIVLASDLYAVNEAIKKESDVKLLLIDASNLNSINSQLDALDELRKKEFPIICLTDTVNSFDLDLLEQRGFDVWRWDEESISKEMYQGAKESIDKKAENCARQKIEYLNCNCEEISGALSILYGNRQAITDASANMVVVYDKLFSIAFICLRSIIDLCDAEYGVIKAELSFCKEQLQREKRFASPEMYNDFVQVTDCFETVFSKQYVFPKITALKDKILTQGYKSICLVIPDRVDKEKHSQYWEKFCAEKFIDTSICVMRQREYCNSDIIACEVTIVCGWFNSSAMKRIIFSYNTPEYIVLLYDYEQHWKNPHTKAWNRTLHKGNKKKFIEKALKKGQIEISRFKEASETIDAQEDELNEIDMILRENKYRQYIIGGGNRNIDEVVEVIPVNFVGGCFAFYKPSHKIVSISDIVFQQKNDIKMIFPTELEVGDFIVVRESQRDLVKELADIILRNSGKSELRELAKKWRYALEIESIFSNFEDIYEKLKKAGCGKNQFTVRQWMRNEDIISPQNKDDLRCIAKATEDAVLLERIDDIFEAGKEVKRAHIQAGKTLSELLKRQVAEKLQELGEIDPYNIWEPVTLYLDDIGSVKVIKVIDIGNAMFVDASNINRLIYEY